MGDFLSISFNPGEIAATSDAASSALALAGVNSDAASVAYDKAAAASSKIEAQSAAWEASGTGRTIKAVIDDYTILVTDGDIVCFKATQLNLGMPPGAPGDLRTVKNVGAGAVVIAGLGEVTMDGDSTLTIYQGESAQFECYSANTWFVV